jgi:hypothetical protein
MGSIAGDSSRQLLAPMLASPRSRRTLPHSDSVRSVQPTDLLSPLAVRPSVANRAGVVLGKMIASIVESIASLGE